MRVFKHIYASNSPEIMTILDFNTITIQNNTNQSRNMKLLQ